MQTLKRNLTDEDGNPVSHGPNFHPPKSSDDPTLSIFDNHIHVADRHYSHQGKPGLNNRRTSRGLTTQWVNARS